MKIINGNCKLMEKRYTPPPRWRFFAKIALYELFLHLKMLNFSAHLKSWLEIKCNYIFDDSN